MTIDWAEAAAWRKRDFAFGALIIHEDCVTMEWCPQGGKDRWRRLCEAWLELKCSPTIIDAIDMFGDELLLRYAALNWKRRRLAPATPEKVKLAASWIIDIADVFKMLRNEVPNDDIDLFWNPVVYVDLD